MKQYESHLFGYIPEPETFDELMHLIIGNSGDPEGDRGVRFWRGQSNINWRIDSAAYRRLIFTEPKKERFDFNLKNYECDLLERATHKGYRIYNGRELSDFELLARLQHHGAATRLVDFSRNALVAIWFSVVENVSITGLLVGIHTHIVRGHEASLNNDQYNTIIEECEQNHGIYTWEPPQVSTRIATQHSQFLYSKYIADSRGSLYLPFETNYTLLVALSPEMKLKLILERSFDLWTYTLFPDIDGFGMANRPDINRWDMNRW